MDPLVGTVVAGRWRLEREVGAGGMAVVFAARHTEIGRQAALKIMRSELASDPSMIARFKREARAASRVECENIVRLYDFGETDDGRFFMAMELVDGETLAAFLARHGPLPWHNALLVARDVARALAAAHAADVVHRDLKPENVMLVGARLEAKVLDFGIARIVSNRAGQTLVRPLTVAGTIVGTPGYISPEAIGSADVGPESDIYSLGVILFEMLAGRAPFVDPRPVVVLGMHLRDAPPRLGDVRPEHGAPAEAEALVARMLAKEPQGRPGAVEVVATLSSYLGEKPAVQLARIADTPDGEDTLSVTVPTSRDTLRSPPPGTSAEPPTDPERLRPTGPIAADVSGAPTRLLPSRGRRRAPPWWVAAGLLAVAVALLVVLLASRGPVEPASRTPSRASPGTPVRREAPARAQPVIEAPRTPPPSPQRQRQEPTGTATQPSAPTAIDPSGHPRGHAIRTHEKQPPTTIDIVRHYPGH